MYSRSIARVSEKFLQMRRALDAVAMRAIGFGIFDEIGVAIGQPPILEAHIRLFPADHAIAVVVEDQHGDVEAEAHRGLHLLAVHHKAAVRSEEHTSELQSLMRISYAVFCLKKKKKNLQR